MGPVNTVSTDTSAIASHLQHQSTQTSTSSSSASKDTVVWPDGFSKNEGIDFIKDKSQKSLFKRFEKETINVANNLLAAFLPGAHLVSGGEGAKDVKLPTLHISAKQASKMMSYFHTFSHLIETLQYTEKTLTLPPLNELLEKLTGAGMKLRTNPVPTPHPTQMSDAAFSGLTATILELFSDLIDSRNKGAAKEIKGEMAGLIEALCLNRPLRAEKPKPLQEHRELVIGDTQVKTGGLRLFRQQRAGGQRLQLVGSQQTIEDKYHVAQQTVKRLARALPDGMSVRDLIKFTTWSCGDHDGHDGVKADTVLQAGLDRSNHVLGDYDKRLEKLSKKLMSSGGPKIVNQEALNHFAEGFRTLDSGQVAALKLSSKKGNPACQAIDYIRMRLQMTSEAINDPASTANRYANLEEFERDINALSDALEPNKTLENLQFRIDVFGFHYMAAELRQNSSVFRDMAGDLLKDLLPAGREFKDLSEEDKVALIKQALSDPDRINMDRTSYTEKSQTELDIIGAGLELQKRIGKQAVDWQIIANCESESDILATMLAHVAAGGYDKETGELQIPVGPLFETIRDMKDAPGILDRLLTTLKELGLRLPNNVVPITLGPSDGSKDGGNFAARVNIYKAERLLGEVAEKHGYQNAILHGVGGNEGRGGGDQIQTIASRSASSTTSRWTVQGEMANHLFKSPALAAGFMAEALVADNARRNDESEVYAAYETIKDELADFTTAHYRAFHEDEPFKNVYFALNRLIGGAKIKSGSRPDKRKDIDDLDQVRAIPHLRPFAIARMELQAYYGFGGGMNAYLAEHPEKMEMIQEMYRNDKQFKVIIDDMETALARANPLIAKEILDKLPSDVQSDAKKFYDSWQQEYQDVKKHVLAITQQADLLQARPDVKKALDQRLPVADAIGVGMAHLMKLAPDDDGVAVATSAVATVLQKLG
jgi:phosphoenolpyruvate carboxylase